MGLRVDRASGSELWAARRRPGQPGREGQLHPGPRGQPGGGGGEVSEAESLRRGNPRQEPAPLCHSEVSPPSAATETALAVCAPGMGGLTWVRRCGDSAGPAEGPAAASWSRRCNCRSVRRARDPPTTNRRRTDWAGKKKGTIAQAPVTGLSAKSHRRYLIERLWEMKFWGSGVPES